MTYNETTILNFLEENGWDVFTKKQLIDSAILDVDDFNRGLRGLGQKAYIIMIEKGKYRLNRFTDENVIGCFMAPDGGVAYWSALNAYGLTEQFPNKIFIQNSKRRGEHSVFGIGATFHFITVKPEKLVGYKTLGYGNHSYFMTDVEKTIVDCFDLPQYAGGYYEIIKAFNKANLSARKMVAYCKAVDNLSVTKRIAYLSELLEKPKMEYFIDYAKEVRNEKYSPFNASLPFQGKYLQKWRLILNMEEKEIREIANPTD